MDGLMMDRPLEVMQILDRARRLFPDKRVWSRRRDGVLEERSYAELHARVTRLASALVSELGVEPGDRVATFGWNNAEHLELYYAIPGAGAVCHTLNIRLSAEQLAAIITHAEDRIIVVDGALLGLFEKVLPLLTQPPRFVVYQASEEERARLAGALDYEALVAAGAPGFRWRVESERQAMGLCYTSGTTGDPKGALYSHRSMYLHTLGVNQADSLGLTERDRVLPVVPQFHAMAWGLPYAALMAGAELVMPGPGLDAPSLRELIVERRVTLAAGVPSIWMALYQELRERPCELSSLRSLVVGGSAMPRSLIEAFEEQLGVAVLHAWGMTELSPLGSVSRLRGDQLGLAAARRFELKARQGTPVAGVEMRIVDDEGREQPWDGQAVGEVQVRGPWVIASYYRRDRAAGGFTDDGWFRTGDVARMSPDGAMTITDRQKDLVKSGGEWISSVELENAIMAHDAVLEAAVIAVPDARWSERPLAVVALRPNGTLDHEGLRAHLEPSFPRFWLPDRTVFVEAIPKTSVGKFDKKALRGRYAEEGAL
jgi:acyl-CoA synthetase (AMP-forming)/AMP-acid ligase II